MKPLIELGARVGAVMQNVCANVDFEVVSLPGGSLIAVLLWLYALRVRSGPRHSSAESPSAALTRQSVRLARGHCPRSLTIPSPHKSSSETAYFARRCLARLLLCHSVRIDAKQSLKESRMNTTISSKFAALAIALAMNSLIMGAVGYLFEIQSHPHMSVISFARRLAAHQWFG
jgi:hypothetical protein